MNNEFQRDERKTEGIQITPWPIRLHDTENVNLHIWDFGGQEIMHATHQFFLTGRGLYLLVLNGREGGEDVDIEYWLKLIESFGADSPVIVVLNKIQSHPFDLNRRGLEEKYPGRIRAFVRTDCEDGTGIEELRETILSETELRAFEKARLETVPKVVDGNVVMVEVNKLLNSVELQASSASHPVSVFVSYSHKDDELRAELDSHLKIFQRSNLIATWHDRRIPPGDDWKKGN